VAQVGYRLHDRVVRPSQVLVSTGPAATTAQEPNETPDGSTQTTE
jgi:hypothetical protein